MERQGGGPRFVVELTPPQRWALGGRPLTPDRGAGNAKLLYMRAIYLPETALEDEEMSATHVADSAHRLAFGDAVAKVREGLYDVSLEQAALLAALHYQSIMGDHDPARDKKGALKRWGPAAGPRVCPYLPC